MTNQSISEKQKLSTMEKNIIGSLPFKSFTINGKTYVKFNRDVITISDVNYVEIDKSGE